MPGANAEILLRGTQNDCKFHGTVAVKTFFLEINILNTMSGDLLVTVTSIKAENNIYRFSEEDLSVGVCIVDPTVCLCLLLYFKKALFWFILFLDFLCKL